MNPHASRERLGRSAWQLAHQMSLLSLRALQASTLTGLLGLVLLLLVMGLTGCGGGGSDSTTSADLTTDDMATADSADSSVLTGDTSSGIDEAVLGAESVVARQAGLSAPGEAGALASEGLAQAQQARPEAVAQVPVSCAGGGTATLTITGGTAASVLNGRFDAGEVYTVVYADCQRVSGGAKLNGTLGLAITAAETGHHAATATATALAVTGTRGTNTLNGSLSHDVTSSIDANGLTTRIAHLTSPSLTLDSVMNGRSRSATLSALDLTRTTTWLNGVWQSGTLVGSHTMSYTNAKGKTVTWTASTDRSLSYAGDGSLLQGQWTITRPHARVTVSIANGQAQISIDEGKDGTVDRQFSVALPKLLLAAG